MASMDPGLQGSEMSSITVMRSPAADRNKEYILKVLKNIIPPDAGWFVLEIGSGTGQHVNYFSEHLPEVTWQPSECDDKSLKSIRGYLQVTQRPNILDPVYLRTTEPVEQWANNSLSPGSCDLILCVNMIHISEWASAQGLFNGSGHYLKAGGLLVTYGPYAEHGEIKPESNVQFDRMLKQQNSDWGLRDIDDLEQLAQENGLVLENKGPITNGRNGANDNHLLVWGLSVCDWRQNGSKKSVLSEIDMPSNNKTFVFCKS